MVSSQVLPTPKPTLNPLQENPPRETEFDLFSDTLDYVGLKILLFAVN